MNQVVFWLILLIILVAIEIATMGLTTIWFAGGAFVAIIAAAFDAPLYVQITLFLSVSVVLLLFTRPIAMKYFNRDRIKTNAESLIGKQAIVTEEVDNLMAAGTVSVDGQEWTARNVMDGVKLPRGTIVIIRAISGVKLIVEERNEGMQYGWSNCAVNYSCTYHHPAGIMYQDCTAGSGICCGKAGRLPGDLERGPEIKNAFY